MGHRVSLTPNRVENRLKQGLPWRLDFAIGRG